MAATSLEGPTRWLRAVRLVPLLLAACASSTQPGAPASILDASGAKVAVERVQTAMASADVLLLGEVHDHPAVHATRLRVLQDFVGRHASARGGPVTLVMEHFDVDREAQLDAARRAAPTDVEAWIAAGAPPARTGGAGWPWPLLRPVLELARDGDLPVRAANPSRNELRARAASGAAVPSVLAPAAVERLRATLEAGHCGLLKGPQLQPMIVAQEARDRRMAEVIVAANPSADAPVVLLAGNGHVRRDFGVPAHLRGRRVLSVGFVERASVDEALAARAYDFVLVFAPHPREDPCAGLQRRFAAPPKPG
jgi:uncharacterized iron-regulated protein